MADRYRAYDPASYYGRDPQAGYHMYDPRGTALPPNYPSHATVVPGDYIPRAPIPPREYATRPPSPPDDYISRAHSRAYGLDGPAGVANIPGLPGMSGLPAGAGARAPGPSPLEDSPLAPLEDPALTRRSTSLGKSAGVPDVEHHSPLLDFDGPSGDASNILFVDGLPSDCTRREVAHLFRPFVGFKDIRVVHKEPRRSGDKGYVLCFVEFEDAKYAFAAMEALQAYRFDDTKPDDPVLKIHFARFPFCMPGAEADKKRAVIRR